MADGKRASGPLFILPRINKRFSFKSSTQIQNVISPVSFRARYWKSTPSLVIWLNISMSLIQETEHHELWVYCWTRTSTVAATLSPKQTKDDMDQMLLVWKCSKNLLSNFVEMIRRKTPVGPSGWPECVNVINSVRALWRRLARWKGAIKVNSSKNSSHVGSGLLAGKL